MSSPASLPQEINRSAERGELQKVIKWLRKGGLVDAFCPSRTCDGSATTKTLLHTATTCNHLAMVRELLKRGASVDLASSLDSTALMQAAGYGNLSILLVLLQHSANPDLQNIDGVIALMAAAVQGHEPCVKALLRAKANTELIDKKKGRTALMSAAGGGHEPCVKALLRAKANTELLDNDGFTALQHAEAKGHTATAQLLRQHAAPPQPATAAPAAPTDACEPVESAPASLPLEIYESA